MKMSSASQGNPRPDKSPIPPTAIIAGIILWLCITALFTYSHISVYLALMLAPSIAAGLKRIYCDVKAPEPKHVSYVLTDFCWACPERS